MDGRVHEARSFSSVVTVIVTSETLVESVGEYAEEAGGAVHVRCWNLNHCLAPFGGLSADC